MSRNGSRCEDSDVLNSSFYSSTSINTLDHAKTFRNSLILADIGEQDFNNLAEQTSEGLNEQNFGLPPASHYKETATIKMSTSPSLSALAGILNEKSKKASEKLKSSDILGSPTMEEEEELSETGPVRQGENFTVPTAGGTSPNLFELNDNEEVYCPSVNTSGNLFSSVQPDFLSSPKPGKEDSHQLASAGEQISVKSQQIPEATRATKQSVPYRADSRPRAQRTVSANLPTEQHQQGKKRKNFFSFLKRRHSTEILATDNSGIPNSMTFSLSNSTASSQLSPDRLTKKSYSSSNIFSTFRKNKEPKKESELHKEQRDSNQESIVHRKHSALKNIPSNDINKALPENPKGNISKRKPTPLHYEHLHNVGEELTKTIESPREAVTVAEKEDVIDVFSSKLDTGEVLFPRSLDKQEVDSIVSIERSRSTKSNKRSSVASHRRSLTETLSINAQNEGMFVMEASSVVLSTPDLSKSPASSILRHGKFDPIDFSSNNSILQDDSGDPAISGSSTQNPLLSSEPTQYQLSMASIEEKLNELTVDPEEVKKPIDDQLPARSLDDDPEFMSDIMEFASIINFGDGVNLDFDSKTDMLDPGMPTLKPIPTVISAVPTTEEYIVEQETKQPGLGITYNNLVGEHEGSHPVEPLKKENEEEEEFENEDFNTLSEIPQESPRLKAFMPEFEINRPLSMSFRGLKAPSFNASITGSSATDSLLRADPKSFASSERRPYNNVNFSSKIILYETYGEDEYDRKPDIATCNQLTPQLAQLIKAELNELKSDMEVHEESQCYTHFF